MTLGILFWLLMIIWFIFGVVVNRGILAGPYVGWGNSILLFILFALLGWRVFGPVIQ
jgi:hypothetical protein